MLDTKDLLVKSIALIYRSRQIGLFDHDDLVRTVLDTVKIRTREESYLASTTTSKLKDCIYKLMEEKEPILYEVLFPTLSVILEGDQKLLDLVIDVIEPIREEASIKRTIAGYVKNLNNYYREHEGSKVISRIANEIKFNRNKITDFGSYIKEVMAELEPFSTMMTSIKDPVLMGEIDFENPESLENVINEMKHANDDLYIYKTGWQGINDMFCGGFRPTDHLINIGALQHNYKSSMLNTLFAQLCVLNKPFLTEEEREKGIKPLILKISIEDSLVTSTLFIYQYLKATQGEILDKEDLMNLPTQEISSYIEQQLTSNGWYVKMLRADSSQADISWLTNLYLNLEAQGYKVVFCILDYVGAMITRGCVTGSIGDDRRNLLQRCRNLAARAGGSMITAMQLSSAAKQLLKNGVPDHQLLREINNKGYYQGTAGADQEFDVAFLLKLCTVNKQTFLNVHWEKHRSPLLADPEDFNIYIPFENGRRTPLMPDIDRDKISIKTLSRVNETINGSTRKGSLLDEVLGR